MNRVHASARNCLLAGISLAAVGSLAMAPAANATPRGQVSFRVAAGDLVLSRTVYTGSVDTVVPGVTKLPAGCTTDCVTAIADGGYPEVFNNEQVDGSFGVSSPVFLDELTTAGQSVGGLELPSDGSGKGRNGDHLVTSFPSKSELGLNVSTGGDSISFMGYAAPANQLDVSNSNTPGVQDPTNPVGVSYYRAVANIGRSGHVDYTLTNAYSGNNGRSAILNSATGAYYTAGNAGNGGNPQPAGVIAGAGAQFIRATNAPQSAQRPGFPTPLGSFSVTQLGYPADKVGKDTNFRGITIHNNVVYVTKGSGGNGINTVYFIDTTGKACPNGVGTPAPGAQLPSGPLPVDMATLQQQGVTPYNMCVLKGFPTALKSKTSFPFGMWFADDKTLYVADEGSGDTTYDPTTNSFTKAAKQTSAGLQKWVFDGSQWNLAYTIQNGLNLGKPYSVGGYPTGVNAVTGIPWAPATDGLRNITGKVNADGTVSIWAVTSTVSGATDTGADPNRLVTVTDPLTASRLGSQSFAVVRTAVAGEALRGIVYMPAS